MIDISNADDIIDSRDVIAHIDELREALFDTHQAEGGCDSEFEAWLSGNSSEEAEELRILEALAEEGEAYAPDWEYGETLIRASYFTEYAEELVKDTEGLPRELPAYIVIDWEATAENLKVYYTEIEFDGVAYLIR